MVYVVRVSLTAGHCVLRSASAEFPGVVVSASKTRHDLCKLYLPIALSREHLSYFRSSVRSRAVPNL